MYAFWLQTVLKTIFLFVSKKNIDRTYLNCTWSFSSLDRNVIYYLLNYLNNGVYDWPKTFQVDTSTKIIWPLQFLWNLLFPLWFKQHQPNWNFQKDTVKNMTTRKSIWIVQCFIMRKKNHIWLLIKKKTNTKKCTTA